MNSFLYSQYSSVQSQSLEEQQKSKDFMNRIEPFKMVTSLEEAKELASKILPTKEGLTNFCVGNISCTIINDKNYLRISIDSPEEFTSYDFS